MPGIEEVLPSAFNYLQKEGEYGVAGIINVVSYGYDFPDSGGSMEGQAPWARQREIDYLAQFVRWLRDAETPSWLITVVTKGDLWWQRRDEVRAYYECGPYSRALREYLGIEANVLLYSSLSKQLTEVLRPKLESSIIHADHEVYNWN